MNALGDYVRDKILLIKKELGVLCVLYLSIGVLSELYLGIGVTLNLSILLLLLKNTSGDVLVPKEVTPISTSPHDTCNHAWGRLFVYRLGDV